MAPIKREVSLGILEPLSQPPRAAHPICLDAGMSWSYAPDTERLDTACYICEIAGIRTLHDRLWWGEVEKG